MLNNVLRADDDREKCFVLWVAKMLLLFRLDSKADSIGAKFVPLHYIAPRTVLNKVSKMLGGVCLSRSRTDNEDHSAFLRKNQKRTM